MTLVRDKHKLGPRGWRETHSSALGLWAGLGGCLQRPDHYQGTKYSPLAQEPTKLHRVQGGKNSYVPKPPELQGHISVTENWKTWFSQVEDVLIRKLTLLADVFFSKRRATDPDSKLLISWVHVMCQMLGWTFPIEQPPRWPPCLHSQASTTHPPQWFKNINQIVLHCWTPPPPRGKAPLYAWNKVQATSAGARAWPEPLALLLLLSFHGFISINSF